MSIGGKCIQNIRTDSGKYEVPNMRPLFLLSVKHLVPILSFPRLSSSMQNPFSHFIDFLLVFSLRNHSLASLAQHLTLQVGGAGAASFPLPVDLSSVSLCPLTSQCLRFFGIPPPLLPHLLAWGSADRTFLAPRISDLVPSRSSLTHTFLWDEMSGTCVGKIGRLNPTQQGTKTLQFW